MFVLKVASIHLRHSCLRPHVPGPLLSSSSLLKISSNSSPSRASVTRSAASASGFRCARAQRSVSIAEQLLLQDAHSLNQSKSSAACVNITCAMLRAIFRAPFLSRSIPTSRFRSRIRAADRIYPISPFAANFSTNGTYIYVRGKHKGVDGDRSSLINAYVQSMSLPEVHAAMHVLAMRLHADGVSAPGRATTMQQMQDEFKLVDKDSDSKISEEEFVAYLNVRDALSKVSAAPSSSALRKLFISSLLPFVGFGMMDNGLMILFGDAIETHIGAVLTISTMACAAIGNWLSDLVGVLSGSTVEKLAQRCGLPHHGLSLEQLDTTAATRAKSLGALVGISIGCFLGMLPLCFIDSKSREGPIQHQNSC